MYNKTNTNKKTNIADQIKFHNPVKKYISNIKINSNSIFFNYITEDEI